MSGSVESDKEKEKGNAAFATKNYDSALKFYTSAIQLNDKNHVLYSNRSVTYLMMGDNEKALDDASTCINLKPDWPKVPKIHRNCIITQKGYFRKMEALINLKRYSDALPIAKQGAQYDKEMFKESVPSIENHIKIQVFKIIVEILINFRKTTPTELISKISPLPTSIRPRAKASDL